MGRLLTRKWLKKGLLAATLLCCTLGLVLYPNEVSAAVQKGLLLCGNVIIPALFPFFILTSLVISLGLAGALGRLLEPVMRPLFHLSGACAAPLALGFVGGYPIGARAALTLYQSGQCSQTEAERLLAFCNNSGPAFILGVVGAGVFADSRVGLLLCLTHAASSLCVGLLFRFYHGNEKINRAVHIQTPIAATRFSTAFTQAVKDGLNSSLNICAFVICFTVILRLATLSGLIPALAEGIARLLAPLGMTRGWAEKLLTGVLELSSGVTSLTTGPLAGRLSLAAFLLGWAGLSVHCQVLSFLGSSGLSPRTYLVGKLLHGLISAALTALLFRLFPFQAPVGAYLNQQVEGIATIDLSTALTHSAAAAWVIFLFFLLAGAINLKKAEKTSGTKGKTMI